MAQITPDVAGERLVVAHAADLAAFEEPQQLRLHRLGQLADLVQEERAAVGHLEQPDAMLVGPGERPLAMAEQLAFDQVLRQGAAIDRHQRHFRPQALIVQRPGDQFLARARLAHDQHGRIGGGHLGDQAADELHAGRVADQLRASLPGVASRCFRARYLLVSSRFSATRLSTASRSASLQGLVR